MDISAQTPIAELVREVPAAIAILQRHGLAFCCTGKTSLSEASAHHGIAPERLLEDINNARAPRAWDLRPDAPLAQVIAHIQEHYHQHFRVELPRISAMLEKLVRRHGERLPDLLPPLKITFEKFRGELIAHMDKEDSGVFPAIVNLEAHQASRDRVSQWLRDPIDTLELEHRDAKSAMIRMRDLTASYTPPEDACPTFRGAYDALSELEADMKSHIQLEDDVLFPGVLALAQA